MNFALILFVLTVVTGIFYVAERMKFLPERRAKAEEAVRRFEEDNREALERMEPSVVDARNDLRAKLLRQPWWLEYTAGLFPVIAIVFLLRSFLFEPFRIPSGSMLPTLHVGDFILVNKYDYGLRLPVANTKVLEIGAPKRGDVIVFRYPVDTSIDYIKRVVGVPGDTVEYRNKVLYVNGVEQKLAAPRDFIDENTMVTLTEYDETLGDVTHLVAFDHRRPSWVPEGAISKKEPTCTTSPWGTTATTARTAATGASFRTKTWWGAPSSSGPTSATCRAWAVSAKIPHFPERGAASFRVLLATPLSKVRSGR